MTLEEVATLSGMTMREAAAAGSCRWLTDLFLSEGGRARMEHWIDVRRPAADPDELLYLGADHRMERLTRACLLLLPPPVRHFAATRVIFVGVGGNTFGWHQMAGNMATLAIDRKHVIGVTWHDSDGETSATIGHEIGHAWLSPEHAPNITTPAARNRSYNGQPPLTMNKAMLGYLAALIAHREKSEWQAASLAESWGFVGRAANPLVIRDGIRQAAEREVLAVIKEEQRQHGHNN